jgi:hypothetical protein
MAQLGGYSDDPLGIWVIDDVAREHKMEQWLAMATPEKKEADARMVSACLCSAPFLARTSLFAYSISRAIPGLARPQVLFFRKSPRLPN